MESGLQGILIENHPFKFLLNRFLRALFHGHKRGNIAFPIEWYRILPELLLTEEFGTFDYKVLHFGMVSNTLLFWFFNRT